MLVQDTISITLTPVLYLPVCANNRFLCPDEERCILESERCDGEPHCYAGADEENCGGKL